MKKMRFFVIIVVFPLVFWLSRADPQFFVAGWFFGAGSCWLWALLGDSVGWFYLADDVGQFLTAVCRVSGR